MNLLIVGAGGQLGEKLALAAQGDQIYGTYKSRPPTSKLSGSFLLDKTDREQVKKVIERLRPDAVIDTGALHNVDYCETHAEEAFNTNARGTQNLANACREFSAKYVFVSTDFVFDGVGAPYSEEATPNPLSVYAESKLEGEKLALSANEGNTVVVRPAVIYSWVNQKQSTSSSGKPLNFGAWLVTQLLMKKELNIVKDQITSPTLANDLAEAILALVRSPREGLFHTAGATALSRYDFSVLLARKLGLDSNLIRPIPSSELKQVAKRPLNSSLVSQKIEREVGYRMRNIDEALEIFADEAREGITGAAS